LERRERVLQARCYVVRHVAPMMRACLLYLLGEDVNKLLTEKPDHPAVWSYGGTGEVSREFINLVSEFQPRQEYDSMTAALLCREAYELGRREGRMCSPKEAITTVLVVAATLLVLGAYLVAHGL
jgi:hypothetical protein